MANENSTEFKLDLDVSDAISGLNEVKDKLGAVGETDSLSGLIETFGNVGLAMGSVAAAGLILKEAFDLTLEGEQIDAINNQFNLLATNMGIAGDALKESLTSAAGGLVSETDLLQSANKGMVELGANAQDLGQLMTVARQVSAVTGGDIKSNFDQITQAVASGQTRMLRSMGIIIDQKKAYEDYAKSIGISANELNKAGQQHAIMNAVLEQTKKQFDGVDLNAKQATNAFQEFKVAIQEIKEVVEIVFAKTLGPIFAEVFQSISNGAHKIKDELLIAFGGKDKALDAQIDLLKNKITDMSGSIESLKKHEGIMAKILPASVTQAQIEGGISELNKMKAALADLEAKKAAGAAKGTDNVNKLSDEERKHLEINLEQRKKDMDKLQAETDKLAAAQLQRDLKDADTEVQVLQIHKNMELQINKDADTKIAQLKAQRSAGDLQKNKLLNQQILILEKKKDQDIRTLQAQLDQDRINALNNLAQREDNVAKSITASWKSASLQASQDLENFAKLGQVSFQSFNQNAQSAFIAIGQGSQSAGDAMKGFMLNSLADIAQSQGAVLLASALLNPLNGAAGAALLVLSGVLKAAAGSAGASGGGVSSSVTTGPSGQTGFSGVTTGAGPNAPSNLQQAPQKTVSLTIQGNYYDTNEARTALMDTIRGATDATDFNYYKVGGQ